LLGYLLKENFTTLIFTIVAQRKNPNSKTVVYTCSLILPEYKNKARVEKDNIKYSIW